MIQRILDFLFDQPEFPNKNENYVINIVVREPMLVHVFFSNKTDYFIKVATDETILNYTAEKENLFPSARGIKREYDALVKFRGIYPGLLPEVLFLRKFDRHAILVTKGIRHSTANLEDILQGKLDRCYQIQQFLIGKDRVTSEGQNSLVPVLNQALNSLPSYLLQNIKKIQHAHNWDKILAALPLIPQHGDSAINNFGVTETGLVLFDWEDYALIEVPGFDLSILLVSGCEFNTSKLVTLVENEFNLSNADSFLQPIIDSIGIKSSQFLDLMLIHLIIFHQLKLQHGYGTKIINFTESVLKALCLKAELK